jgi:N-acetylneuraminic acid mutarotase
MIFTLFIIGITWEYQTSAPISRTYPAIGEVTATNTSSHASIYIIGGETGMGQTRTNYEYDCVTDTWAARAQMPSPARFDFGGCSAFRDGVERIYVMGGYQSIYVYLQDVDEYTPSTNSWNSVSDMPTQREGVRIACIGNMIYAIGGDYFDIDNFIDYVYNIVERYDPEEDNWTTGYAPMPTPRTDACCVVAENEYGDSCIYVFGGSTSIIMYAATNAVEEYNPATDSWRVRNSTGFTARGGAMAATDNNNNIYVIGGTSDGASSLNLVQVYDPVTNSWSQDTPIQQARDGITGGVAGDIGGRIHVVVGSTGASAVSTNERSVELVGVEKTPTHDIERSALKIYPNPFSSRTVISFTLNTPAHVLLEMYSVTGQKVAAVVNKNFGSGKHTVFFNAAELPDGVYYCSLTAQGTTHVKPCVAIK